MPAKQKSDERRVKKWNEVINRQSLIIENYENELKEEKQKNRHLIGHLTILKTSAIISPLPQKKKLLKEVPVLKFDSDDEEENKKETLKVNILNILFIEGPILEGFLGIFSIIFRFFESGPFPW